MAFTVQEPVSASYSHLSVRHLVLQLLHKQTLFQADWRTIHCASGPSCHSFYPGCRLPEWHLFAQLLPNWLLAPGPLSEDLLRAHCLPANLLPANSLCLQPCPGDLLSEDHLCLQFLLNSLQPTAHLCLQWLSAPGRHLYCVPTSEKCLHCLPAGGRSLHHLPTSLRGLQDVAAVLRVQLPKNLLSLQGPVNESRLHDLPAVFPGSSNKLPVPE